MDNRGDDLGSCIDSLGETIDQLPRRVASLETPYQASFVEATAYDVIPADAERNQASPSLDHRERRDLPRFAQY